jgi:signal transduction histidine kinase
MVKSLSAHFVIFFTRVISILFFTVGVLSLVCCHQQDIDNTDHKIFVDSISEKAKHMLDIGEFDKAVSFFDSAYFTIENPGTGDEIKKFIFKGQYYYPKIQDSHKALIYVDSIFPLLATEDLKKKYIRDYSNALFQKGDLLFELRRYSDSYLYYYRGNLIARAILDPCAMRDYTYRLGMVSFKQMKYVEAVNNFKQCYEDAAFCKRNFTNFALRQELLSNIALSYAKLNMADSSLVFSAKAIAFIEEEGRFFPDRQAFIEMAKAVVYGNESDQYYKRGDTQTAISLLQKSYETNIQKGFDLTDAQLTMGRLAGIYVELGRLDEAGEIGEKLKASLDTSYNLFADLGLNKFYWKYYDERKEHEKAYDYLQKYIQLKDSIESENKKLVSADVAKEFQNIEQQNSYNMLSKENEQKQYYLYVLAIFILMALAILLLIWQNWRGSKSNVSSLTKLNKQITFQNTQLEQTLDDLQQSNDDKDKILKVVAHDLRNPLGAMVSISSILLDEKDISDENMELLKMLKTSGLQSIEMISDLLSANLNYRPEEMKMEEIDMRLLLNECVDQLRFKAEEKGQQLDLEVIGKVFVLADREKLQRVLSNLIVNAIKFSNLNTAVHIKMTAHEEKMELAIADQGIGIPEDLKNKIFDPFTKAKRWGTSGEQPFGLGLSISKQIIEAHQGKIWFESEENKGTTFYVELPVTEWVKSESSSRTFKKLIG